MNATAPPRAKLSRDVMQHGLIRHCASRADSTPRRSRFGPDREVKPLWRLAPQYAHARDVPMYAASTLWSSSDAGDDLGWRVRWHGDGWCGARSSTRQPARRIRPWPVIYRLRSRASAIRLSHGDARGAHGPAALLWVEVLNCRLDGVCSSLPPCQRWSCSPFGATVLLLWEESRDGCCDEVTNEQRRCRPRPRGDQPKARIGRTWKGLKPPSLRGSPFNHFSRSNCWPSTHSCVHAVSLLYSDDVQ